MATRPSLTVITSRVYSFVAVPRSPEGDELAARVINRIFDTGDCVWHAVAQVTGKPCWCADCRPTSAGAGSAFIHRVAARLSK